VFDQPHPKSRKIVKSRIVNSLAAPALAAPKGSGLHPEKILQTDAKFWHP
jgi:hypothetical protein